MADRYRTCTQREHVQLRPQQYMGSVAPTLASDFFYNQESGRMEYREGVPHCEGLVKLFNEAIDNTIDNSYATTNSTTLICVEMTRPWRRRW